MNRKIKVEHQHDSMQCGITCLQMICRYFGREYSLDSLSKICFATTEGVSMLGINEAVRILGFQTVSARFLRNFSIKTRLFSQNITNLFIASK